MRLFFMPQILPICLFKENCSFKRMKKVRGKDKTKRFIPICTFKGSCNQKRILSVFDLKKANWDISKLRRWEYATRLG